MIADILNKFADSYKATLTCIQDNQKWFSGKTEAFGHKFEDAGQRLKFVISDYERITKNFFLKDDVVKDLTKLQATGFEGFVGISEEDSQQRGATAEQVIAPYRKLIESLPPLITLQKAMLSQAQMKKLPMRYDNIRTNMAKMGQLVNEMNNLLEQAAAFAAKNEAHTSA